MGNRMKAQFIYENLDFERGIDPKQSMGIGVGKFEPISMWNREFNMIDFDKLIGDDVLLKRILGMKKCVHVICFMGCGFQIYLWREWRKI